MIKAKVKSGYVDGKGVHKRGDFVEVTKLDPYLHIPVAQPIEEKKEEKVEKKSTKTSKKTKK